MTLVFTAGGRKFRMSDAAIAAFRATYADRGNGWRVLCACETCGTVCFDGALCECPGHTAERRGWDIGNHRAVAAVADVVARIESAA